MDLGATRMGSQTLGYSATSPRATSPVSVGSALQAPTFWGSLPQGIKTIIKVAVVAAIVYAAASFAIPYLLEIPAVANIAGTASTALAGVGEALTTGVNSALALFGMSPLGSVALTEASAASITSVGSAASAIAAGAAALPAAKAAAITAATHTVPTVPHTTPSVVPDISSQTQAIGPSSVLTQKSALAQIAHGHNTPTVELPDVVASPDHHHGDSGKGAKLGHLAEEVHEKRQQLAAEQRNRLSEIEGKMANWQERVGGEKAPKPTASHTKNAPKRDSSFAASIDQDRQKLENALGV